MDHFIGPLVLVLDPTSGTQPTWSTFLTTSNYFQACYYALWTLLVCTQTYPIMNVHKPTRSFLAIHRDTNALPHNSYIIELLHVVLTNNYFDFNGKHYHQKSGTAMGTKLAPSYANLFMTKFEQIHVYTYHLQPTLWKRFIDDIFLIWPHDMDSLLKFVQHLNTVHPRIKFTSTISPSEIAFLDLTIYIIDDKLCTRLYTKSTDRHMYLNFNSEHPMNLKEIHTLFLISEAQENILWVTLLDTITNPTLLILYMEGIPPWYPNWSLEENQSCNQRSTFGWYHRQTGIQSTPYVHYNIQQC